MTGFLCRALGHRYRFATEGATMVWRCTRRGASGKSQYPSADDAARYAEAFNAESRAGRRSWRLRRKRRRRRG